MGRFEAKKNSSDHNSSKEKKQKKKRTYQGQYQNKFRVGSASQGHGFAIVKKKQFLSKFRRKHKKRKESDTHDVLHIKPLADDSFAKHSSDNANGSVSTQNLSTISRKSKNRNSMHVSKLEIDYQAIQKERQAKTEELKAERAEHEKKIRKNLEKRKKITKKLSKKTKRGQPVMANRLEHILSKLKNE